MKNIKFSLKTAILSVLTSWGILSLVSLSAPLESNHKTVNPLKYEELANSLHDCDIPWEELIPESVPRKVRRYIQDKFPNAVLEYYKFGVLPSIKLTQGGKEAAWGNSRLAKKANNFFGVKKRKRHSGSIDAKDDCGEENCKFAKFDSYWYSSRDHSYILSLDLYSSKHNFSNNYKDWEQALNKYATSEDYGQDIVEIIEKYQLYKLDEYAQELIKKL